MKKQMMLALALAGCGKDKGGEHAGGGMPPPGGGMGLGGVF